MRDHVTIGDREIHYIDQGEGPALLWIHGFPLSAELYRHQLPIPGVRHIVPDLPGFGLSDPYPNPEETTIQHYSRDLIRLLDELKIDMAVLAALSMGGYIALDLMRTASERFRGLILMDTRETPDSEEARTGRLKAIQGIAKASSTREIEDTMLPKLLAERSREDQSLIDLTRSLMANATVPGSIAALHAMAERSDSSDLLPSIEVPSMIVVGEEDAITPPADAERMASLIRNASLVRIEGAGHLPPIENPEMLNRAIERFLGEEGLLRR
jgi:3-oxoadipate enol-lactonase